MFNIRPARSEDADAALAALGDAFAPDPLMHYFFGGGPESVRPTVMAFFSMLLRARLALGMPALVLEQDGAPLGAAMGYDTAPPDWPSSLAEEWDAFEAERPGLVERFDAYEAIAGRHKPAEAHYYLGVIGVHPSLQGQGGGKALLDAFCARSQADTKSSGVFLETASASSLQFYSRNGFELRGEGRLDGMPLWCVYRRT